MHGFLKILWLSFWAFFATGILFFPITLAAFFSRTGNLAFNISKIWAWFILKVTMVKTVIVGREKIEKNQSYIIISNHQSLFDIPALVTQLGIQFRWIIKKELLKIPLFGYALYASKNIFIDRSNLEKTIQSIHKGLKRLPAGVGIIFFAEGTRSADGTLQKFKKGGFVTALETGFPILPVAVSGGNKILPKKSLVFNPGSIRVAIADPIDTREYSHAKLDELMSKTRNAILSCL